MTASQFPIRIKAEGGDAAVGEVRRVEGAIVSSAEAGVTANQRMAESASRLAQKYADLAVQARVNATTGIGRERNSAQVSAEVFQMDETWTRQAAALKAILDPLGAAQDRYNEELREFATLATAGKISQAELSQAQALAKTRLDETTVAIQRQERGLSRLAMASRLNLARQGADVFTTAAMGMNPAMIAIQQGPQIMDAWATSAIKMSPAVIALGVGFGVLAGAVVATGAAFLAADEKAASYERLVSGIGRTAQLSADELKSLVRSAADVGEVPIASAEKQAAAYLKMGVTSSRVLHEAIAIGKDFASVMGVDAEEGVKLLAAALKDPEKGAVDLTRSIGALDLKTIDYIKSLVKAGEVTKAQEVLLRSLSGAVAGHAGQVTEITGAWQAVTRSVSDALTKFNEWVYVTRGERIANLRMEASAPFAIDRAGKLAEANRLEREAAQDEARRAAIGAEGAAKRTALEQREAQEARDKANARGAGERRRLAAEAERERREALQRVRREEDVTAGRALEIARIKQNFGEVRRLEDENAVRARTRQLIDDGTKAEVARTQALKEQAELIEAREIAGQKEAKRLSDAASLEADRITGMNRFVQTAERRAELEARVLAYAKEYDQVTARNMAKQDQMLADQARVKAAVRAQAMAEGERQLRLAQLSGDWRSARDLDRELRIANRAREIERIGVDGKALNYGEGNAQARQQIEEETRAALIGARRGWALGLTADIRSSGLKGAVADQLINASDRMVEHLIDQLMKVKWGNMLGGRLGWVGKGLDFLIGGNADGTDYWRGGLTLVGERGPELMSLPRGTQIAPHGESLSLLRKAPRMVAPAATQRPVVFDLRGAVVTQDLLAQMNQMMASGMATIRAETPGVAVEAVRDTIERLHSEWP